MASWAWWLVLGLLAGWLIEWVIDWVYWRQRRQSFAAELADTRAAEDRLRIELDRANQARERSAGELATTSASLAAARADGEHIQAKLQMLNDAAQRDRADIGTLRTTSEQLRLENERLRDELDASQAALNQYRSAPNNLEVKPEDTPSRQTVLLSADALATPMATLGSEAHAIADRLTRAVGDDRVARQRDPLIDINGIGPVYQQRLFDAGINTFAGLAALAPDKLRTIVKPETWQDVDTEAWITEARALAAQRRSEAL